MTTADDQRSAGFAALRGRLGGVGGRLRPGFRGLWSWWTHALASWLPPRLRALFGLAHERLLLQRDGDGLHLAVERGSTLTEVGRIPWSPLESANIDDPLAPLLLKRAADLPRWLLLPAAAGLQRTLTLPAAAADRVRDVVGFEIDRQTPFSAADVRYDTRIAGRRGDQLDVDLIVVPRATLDRAVAGLGALASTLAGVDMADGNGRALGVNLQADAQRHRRVDPWRNWNLAFAAVALIAVAAGLWQMLDNRQRVADALTIETNARATKARRVAADRQQLINLVEGMRFLQETRAARPTTVEVLDELSRRLPDSTYLEKISIEDDQLMVIGQSGEASALVGRLEGSRLWRSPALTGALQPDPRTHRDRFTLTANLAVAGAKPQEGADARQQP